MRGTYQHDSAVTVGYRDRQRGRSEAAWQGEGWYVLRTCDCHPGLIVSLPYATKAEAERCRDVLIEDARKHWR